jgi:hypothetical protein
MSLLKPVIESPVKSKDLQSASSFYEVHFHSIVYTYVGIAKKPPSLRLCHKDVKNAKMSSCPINYYCNDSLFLFNLNLQVHTFFPFKNF